VRGFIQAMIEGELDEKLQRPRYGRRPKSLINMRKVDGWQTLATKPIDQPIDLAA
jgi:hypothetical protein